MISTSPLYSLGSRGVSAYLKRAIRHALLFLVAAFLCISSGGLKASEATNPQNAFSISAPAWVLAESQANFGQSLLAQSDQGEGGGTPEAAGGNGKEEQAAPAWWEVVFSGGPLGAAIVMGLVLLSMCSVYLVFDQVFALRKKELMPEGLASKVKEALLQGKAEKAATYCQENPSTLSFVLLHGIEEIPFGWSSVEKATEDALSEQAARLYRKTEYLSVIGNIAPMVGLLGTVFGMILAFHRVAQSQGTAAAPELAEGIYQALITTVGGLLVAIPSLGAFAVLRNRLDQLVAETAHVAQNVFSALRIKRKKASSERSKSSNESR